PRGPDPVPARTPEGRLIGELRELDGFPLYELVYRARYAPPARTSMRPEASQTARGGFACTCFTALDERGHRVTGRNFDWQRHPVLVLFTSPPGGHASVSLVDLYYLGYSPARSPLEYPAALADAPALPFDGMNDEGLAVGMMAVSHAEGISGGPGRPRVDELGLIRLLLDRAASVEEAVGILEHYDVVFQAPPVHYFIADRKGNSLVAEYLGGRLRLTRGRGLWQVSTNFIFGEVPPLRWTSSCWRYAKASSVLAAREGRLDSGGSFGLLETVSQSSTIWSSAYDQDILGLELALGRDFGRRFAWILTRADSPPEP
ncbi:MAG TPA: linear amide C-N hydrolase, partial [Rectinemataceae bacterium]|nr:linear amide C-N hydrolase [Rectinemataceae bacterium]